MDLLQRAVPAPQAEIAVHRAARRQVLRDVAPLAAGAQHIHHAVDDLAHVDGALAAATLGRRDQQLDVRPFVVSEIAGIAQTVAVVAMAVLNRPHRAPRKSAPDRITAGRAGSSGPHSRRATDSDDSPSPRTDTYRAIGKDGAGDRARSSQQGEEE